jgi:hypothetical protein
MKQKSWEAQIPKTDKNKDRKLCYTYWKKIGRYVLGGGKVVWLTNKEKTFLHIKYSNIIFEEVVDKDTKEYYKKYLNQTVD